MREMIPIGADHAGVELQARLIEELRALGRHGRRVAKIDQEHG